MHADSYGVRCTIDCSCAAATGRNWPQSRNNIEYHGPVIGGFDVQAQYAFGNPSRGFNYGAAVSVRPVSSHASLGKVIS